uniref:Uncharacterized protein n=1 Tax=Canis lupus familiaris TaxID=9615 RepID=A0A8C0M8J9_CANLF
MEHKKPPFLAPGGASLPGDGCPHSPDGRSSGQARQVASAGASGRPDRGRIHLWPEETAMGARAKPGPGQDQTPAQGRYMRPPPLGRAAATGVQGMTELPSAAAGCVPSGLPGALSLSLLCSECTSPSSPPVMVTGPAALTGPSTGQPTATALGRPPPGLAMPAALAGRGPAGTPWPVEQQYASHRARMGGAVSSQAAVTALQDGRATPARQKLQLVLAPLHSMASRALEHGLPDPSSLLTHSFQQLDRIDSLSEQISFLEEQLGSCECHPPHRAARTWAWG